MTKRVPQKWEDSRGKEFFLPGEDASDLDLSDLDLSGLWFNGLRAPNTNFERCIMFDFRAQDSWFADARFAYASLDEARLFDSVFGRASFRGCLFRHGMLSMCHATAADFEDADLTSTSLCGTCLDDANLKNATLVSVNADGGSFRGADLRGADFRNGSFKNADFRSALLEDVTWDGANLEGAQFDEGARPKL